MAAARDSSCSSRELVEEISQKGKSDPGSFQPLSTDAERLEAVGEGVEPRAEDDDLSHARCEGEFASQYQDI